MHLPAGPTRRTEVLTATWILSSELTCYDENGWLPFPSDIHFLIMKETSEYMRECLFLLHLLMLMLEGEYE